MSLDPKRKASNSRKNMPNTEAMAKAAANGYVCQVPVTQGAPNSPNAGASKCMKAVAIWVGPLVHGPEVLRDFRALRTMTPDPKYLTKSKKATGIFQVRLEIMGKSVPQSEVTRMMKTAPIRNFCHVGTPLSAAPQLALIPSGKRRLERRRNL